ncbi:hypothetical protein SAMN05660477_02431 [Soonwooa buanensis]|uniref:EpsG family protein n=1 Tax=Soonwooa buanensis TaxID=619805 RepID=A0A1T5G071_9FLAO|nr:hypothetical protein [Soonwooa buanensis]SKC01828.1 hypothetical protein SAMN05660477_02431 [Soonwooa buanensis]
MKLDKFLSKLNLKLVAYLITIATAVYTLAFTFLHNKKSDGYILGDWLINYQDGGFKRRGLSGSFFFLLQDLTGFPLNYLVFGFQLVIIVSFFFVYFKIIKNRKLDLLYISLMLSSVGFVGLFNCVDYAGKKEFIIFLLFALLVFWLINNKLTKTKEWIIVLGLFITMFLHEIALFFVPYFVIALYLKEEKFELKRYIKYFAAVFIPAVLIVLFGKEINEGHSLAILKERGVVFTRGIFFWDINEREYIKNAFDDYRWYFLSLAISIFHVIFYLKTEKICKIVGWMILGAFLFSLPLFVLAIDWGRWMYIHMMFLIIMFPILIKPTKTIWEYFPIQLNKTYLITFVIIFISLIYRVEMSGKGFTFEGLFYRVFFVPFELIHKMI